MPIQHQLVQSAHAAIESTRSYPSLKSHPNLVILGVPDEQALHDAVVEMRAMGVYLLRWHEPDMGGRLTAVASGPIYGEDRKNFRHYKLWRQS